MQVTQLFAALELEHFEKEGEAFHREIARKVGAKLEAHPEALKTCLERIRSLILSDRVGFFFNVSAELEGETIILAGESERPEFKKITREVFRHLGFTSVVDRVEIVPDWTADPPPFGVAIQPHVMTWSRPNLTGIPMDEALYGEPVYVLKELAGAVLIKNFSGYWGYAAKAEIRRITKTEFIRLVNAATATLTEDYRTLDQFVPRGSRLAVKDQTSDAHYILQGPSGEPFKVPKFLCLSHNRSLEIQRVLEQARSYLRTPYNLGGKNSSTGIDCSGLVQMAYRTIGVNLARDAKQQYLSGNLILPGASEALLPGDALFFMGDEGQVDHTALYLGSQEILHATGPEVKIQSLDPASTNYFKRFTQDFIGAKRFWW
ncbi:MAG TPA: C40 family peptidase [Candidatus Paceibacterota bacterium]|nr:C40 family peptidase [Verrucomicrobiota bacterium]HRY48862.1 C40 family peptidase [Candidatus Paceibacterota bacterium]HSA01680.1 C40 family peptidase [Candidatus Paceibacterota bacterium]